MEIVNSQLPISATYHPAILMLIEIPPLLGSGVPLTNFGVDNLFLQIQP